MSNPILTDSRLIEISEKMANFLYTLLNGKNYEKLHLLNRLSSVELEKLPPSESELKRNIDCLIKGNY